MERYHHAIKFGKHLFRLGPSIPWANFSPIQRVPLLLARFDLPTSSISLVFFQDFHIPTKSPVITRFMICFAIEVPFQAVSPKISEQGHPKIYNMNSCVYAVYIYVCIRILQHVPYIIYIYTLIYLWLSLKVANPKIHG